MKISEALRETRNEVGNSQEHMALELGVSRRTVQNWEMGVSEPSVGQAIAWFKINGKNPAPYLLQHSFPELEIISPQANDDKIREGLLFIISNLPIQSVRQLMYLFNGDHGSSPTGILQLMTAHLQTPLNNRVTQAGVIVHNYEMAVKKGNVTNPDRIQPDLEFLKVAVEAGENAVVNGAKEYTI